MVYRIEKSLFFLRPFYVLSTSFLRNGYMEVRKLHILHTLCINFIIHRDCYFKAYRGYPAHVDRSSDLYPMASSRCAAEIFCSPERSAMVRATLRMRSYARADKPSRFIE